MVLKWQQAIPYTHATNLIIILQRTMSSSKLAAFSRRTLGKLGTVTYLIAFFFVFFVVLFFFGLPTGSGRTRLPSSLSSLLRKLSLPSLLRKLSLPNGLPVCVLERRRPSSRSGTPPASRCRHRAADIISCQRERFNTSDRASASTCAAALDHS